MIRFASRIGPTCSGENSRSNGSAIRQRYTICDPSGRRVRFRAVPRPIGIALLGAGWMGDVHSSSYRRVPFHYPDCDGKARLVVVADEVEERARKAAEAYGYERWTTDWR